MFLLLNVLRFLILMPVACLAATKSVIWNITNTPIAPNGFNRSASLVNGIHPGPPLTAMKGDRLNVTVNNLLNDATQVLGTSIHWHGLLQRGTNFMDGVVGVNQCPIASGNSFTYVFNADTPGTWWYHSHFGVQYCDGVRGALIIYDPGDPLMPLYDVDDIDTIITLSDWYNVPAPSITGIPSADSTLINGAGRYPGGVTVPLAVVRVIRGMRYRFRLVSISCDPNYTFSIDGHELKVIEVEGVAVRPVVVNSIQIFAGQRYSVVLAANQPVSNYWIRALPNSGNRNINSTFENGVNSAILRYSGAPNSDPTTTQQITQIPLVETDLHPSTDTFLPGTQQPDGADCIFNLTLGFNETSSRFTINNVSYVPPPVPVLLQILSGAHTAQDLLPKGAVYTLERNKTVQVNIPSGLIGGPHPFHLHGHTFSVVRSADSGNFNFNDPVKRDVVNVGSTQGDFVSIRFTTDNPGPWILHCHIDFHLNAGLALVFAEAPNDTAAANPNPPVSWFELCPDWDSPPGDISNVPATNMTST